jgi:DNA polymerase/3'-5' exonuclease PolX
MSDLIFYEMVCNPLFSVKWYDTLRCAGQPIHLKSIDGDKSMKLRDLSVIRTMGVKTIKLNVEMARLKELKKVKQALLKLEFDMSSLGEVKILGGGAFGVGKLMKNSEVNCLQRSFFTKGSNKRSPYRVIHAGV